MVVWDTEWAEKSGEFHKKTPRDSVKSAPNWIFWHTNGTTLGQLIGDWGGFGFFSNNREAFLPSQPEVQDQEAEG